MLAVVFAVSFAVSLILKHSFKRYIVSIVSILTATGIFFGAFFGVYKYYKPLSQYSNPDEYTDLCKDKTILLVVPHQDDDLNISSGMIDILAKNSSRVFIVFTTNGDAYGLGETRLNESLNVAKQYNIPESNIIFLGYPNELDPCSQSLYNSEPDEKVTSKIGRTETYGLENHPAYREGIPYTRNNLKSDLISAILEVKPDIIFAVDCDFHPDHRMTSLIFEESMGEILAKNTEYKPLVFKTFAYCTSFYGIFDFYQKNIFSTKVECKDGLIPNINIYKWSERVRFPVSSASLSRYIENTSTYNALSLYASQYIIYQAEGAINGDRVFWKRDTNSILYNAEINASSGNASLLNNFKLLDFNDVVPIDAVPFDGVWVPLSTDKEKKVIINLAEPSDISEIRLYDNPSLDDNILKAEITFDDGTTIETQELQSNGSATKITCNQKNVKSFEVSIKESKGQQAGFTEIEAYKDVDDSSNFVHIMKVVNSNDDFVYDYYIDKSGSEEFSLYKYNCAPVKDTDYEITCDNSNCTAEISNGVLKINCPKGNRCTVSIADKVNGLVDTVVFSNPRDAFMRNLAQRFDKMYSQKYSIENQKKYYYETKSEIYKFIFDKSSLNF
ncbi:MAG: PIG-L family deacetylase [Clostridia bacterium]|nr:PIG-L family deacetylase [Clostridia bacterium]